jgi:hypothetical protein
VSRGHAITDEELLAHLRALNPIPVTPASGERAEHAAMLGRIVATPRAAPTPRQESSVPSGWHPSRRAVIAAAAAVTIAVPLAALAAAQTDWRLLPSNERPAPVGDVHVIKTGTWDGKPWQMYAYLSSTDGVCFALVMPASAHPEAEGGLACDRIEGIPPTEDAKPFAPHGISFLVSFAPPRPGPGTLPGHIAGPVVASAEAVEIHFSNGRVVTTETFDAPEELGEIRFFATELPPRKGRAIETDIVKLVGVDRNGREVTCLRLPMPGNDGPLPPCS